MEKVISYQSAKLKSSGRVQNCKDIACSESRERLENKRDASARGKEHTSHHNDKGFALNQIEKGLEQIYFATPPSNIVLPKILWLKKIRKKTEADRQNGQISSKRLSNVSNTSSAVHMSNIPNPQMIRMMCYIGSDDTSLLF